MLRIMSYGALVAGALVGAGCAVPQGGARTESAPARTTAGTMIWSRFGVSVEGRPLEAVTIGTGLRRVLIIGGIHGDETEGLATIGPLAEHLASSPALREVTVCIARDANPDGTAAQTRGNARRVDLNRNWPASNFAPGRSRGIQPLTEPETTALHELIGSFTPELVIVFHSTPSGPFVNYDGPAERQARAFADAAALADQRWRVVPNVGYPTPGSLGTYMGVDLGVPILTIEFARKHAPDSAWDAVRACVDALLSAPRPEDANPETTPR
ncbi:MAG: succinylglutamate desuccinylase/aspartoacylase family protein [Phycisphaeraceae bacterium]|nr:succinylglutamate desuccinylase/aspartoacylase family protein [Phycisphaeraceae bacterium]